MTRLWLILAAVFVSQTAVAQEVSRAAVTRWLEAYETAWETRDPAAAGRLFAADARYFETPWSEPFEGSSGVRDYWAGVTLDQRNVQFEFEIVAVNGSTAVARWNAEFELTSSDTPIAIDGVFILQFDSPDTVGELREWWVVRP